MRCCQDTGAEMEAFSFSVYQGLEGVAHLLVLRGAVAGVEARLLGRFQPWIEEDEAAGGALRQGHGERFTLPDSLGQERRDYTAPLERESASANDAAIYLDQPWTPASMEPFYMAVLDRNETS